MSLAERMRREFGPGDRSRGREYFAEGRVTLVKVSDRGAVAAVDGSRQYLVLLDASQARDDGLLFVHCDCPRHEDRIWCKHVFATLLALDAQGITLGTDSQEVDLAFDDPELYEFEEMGDFDDSEDEPRGGPPSRAWEENLAALERFLPSTSRERVPAARAPERELLFQIDAASSRMTGELAVSFLERKRKKDGEWGKPRPARLRRPDVASTADPSERELLELLFTLGAREALARGFSLWGELKVGNAAIPSSLDRLIVPRLAATGRLYWSIEPLEGEQMPPLAWDDGPAYRLTMKLSRAGGGKGMTLAGSLQREDEKRSVAEVVLLLGSGLVCFGDRIAALEKPGDTLWAAFLQETDPSPSPTRTPALSSRGSSSSRCARRSICPRISRSGRYGSARHPGSDFCAPIHTTRL